MRITTLVDNNPNPGNPRLVAEWGLSQCIEVNGRCVLLDMGASDAFARNAEALGIDLASIDAAILSHHHSDHGGGLRRFLESNDRAPVYLGEAPDGEPTGRLFHIVRKYIGLDRALMAGQAQRFHVVREPTEVLPGVFVLPHIGSRYPRPAGNKVLFVRKGRQFTPDDFRHEVVVALREGDTLAVLTGCSHSGVLNMVDTVQRHFPGVPVKAVIGGFHLVALPPFNRMSDSAHDVAEVGRTVLEMGVETTWTGHCTGSAAFKILHGAMGDRARQLHTGAQIEL